MPQSQAAGEGLHQRWHEQLEVRGAVAQRRLGVVRFELQVTYAPVLNADVAQLVVVQVVDPAPGHARCGVGPPQGPRPGGRVAPPGGLVCRPRPAA